MYRIVQLLASCVVWLRSLRSFKWAVMVMLTLAPLSASAHYCRLKRGDSKYLCLAQQEESVYFCRYVKSRDLKNRCVASLYGKKSYCGAIKDSEQKARCESEAEARAVQLERLRAAQEAKKLAQQKPPQGRPGSP